MKRPRAHRSQSGMTILEIMVVLAIMVVAIYMLRTGFRMVTKADLVENSTELSAIMRRTQQLSVETAALHRVTFDMDKGLYVVEQCSGTSTIQQNEALRPDDEKVKRAEEKGKDRLRNVPQQALTSDPEQATKQALALAGHHIADRVCVPVEDGLTGDVEKDTHSERAWIRTLRAGKGIKFKEIWVQHREDSATKGQVAVYFFPNGSAEKAIIELTDGSDTFSVLVFGLTGRVVLKDGELRDVEDHMLKNPLGDKDKERDAEGATE
ncbi:MAG TPA: type II secretion system protein [Kofleriaceae bacterium]|nr:type II secretion system protein [Kofleriaceae bacterium]